MTNGRAIAETRIRIAEAVLDRVPLAGSRREVAHMDRHAEFVGEPLKLVLADARSIAATAASVGVDEDLALG